MPPFLPLGAGKRLQPHSLPPPTAAAAALDLPGAVAACGCHKPGVPDGSAFALDRPTIVSTVSAFITACVLSEGRRSANFVARLMVQK